MLLKQFIAKISYKCNEFHILNHKISSAGEITINKLIAAKNTQGKSFHSAILANDEKCVV
jgi:hypothetical protein